MRRLPLLPVFFALLLFLPREADALQCAAMPTVADELARSPFVFVVDAHGNVTRTFKGKPPRHPTFAPGWNTPDPVNTQTAILFYGKSEADGFHANTCGRTRPVVAAKDDLAALAKATGR